MKFSTLTGLLLLASLCARGEVNMVSGYVYDVGKGSYSSDKNVTDRSDKNLCWAATAANIFQHWLDYYMAEGALAGGDSPTGTAALPNGFADASYKCPGGTQYLDIYNDFQANFTDGPGLLLWATEWFFNGKDSEALGGETSFLKDGAGQGGYLPGAVDTYSSVYGHHFGNLTSFQEVLDIVFGIQGTGVYLGLKSTGNIGHAITCWGYETDEDGLLNALYITDSDDRQYGARRVDVREEKGKIYISSPYRYGNYYNGTYQINEVSFIANEETAVEKDGNTMLTEIPGSGEIEMACDMTGRKLSSATGIATMPESMLVASGGKGTQLTLGGGEELASGTGLDARAGSMVSLNNAAVSISKFGGDGITVGCEVNLSGGSVVVSGNAGTGIAVQGTQENPKAFLQMNGNSLVEISGNGKGGITVDGSYLEVYNNPNGVYAASDAAVLQRNTNVDISGNSNELGGGAHVTGSLSFRNNDTVTIADNTAEQGSALYVAEKRVTFSNNGYTTAKGNVDITDNRLVSITGNRSTVSDVIDSFGNALTISGNVRVDISGNDANASTAAADGNVIHNSSTLTIEDNGSVTFSDNKALYDIFNEGTVNISASAGQSITFEHGVRNHNSRGIINFVSGDQGTAGTYRFKNGNAEVSFSAGKATINESGGAIMRNNGDKGTLNLSHAQFDSDTEFAVEEAYLNLYDVAFGGDVHIDLGYFGELNKLTFNDVTFTDGSTLYLVLDLGSNAGKEMPFVSYGAGEGAAELTQVQVNMGDYIATTQTSLEGINLALTVTGTLADEAMLIINTDGFAFNRTNVDAVDCIYMATSEGKLYYKAPEPATTTFSLLALSFLLGARRRKA